jgi:hypothetical protein
MLRNGILWMVLAGLGFTSAATAQTYKSPIYNSCIRQFYDPDMYNWLAFENRCSEALSVVFIPYRPGYGGGAADIRPGRKTSTGHSRSEVDDKGGFELYVCPEDYLPVDAEDRYVTRVNTPFRCKQH